MKEPEFSSIKLEFFLSDKKSLHFLCYSSYDSFRSASLWIDFLLLYENDNDDGGTSGTNIGFVGFKHGDGRSSFTFLFVGVTLVFTIFEKEFRFISCPIIYY